LSYHTPTSGIAAKQLAALTNNLDNKKALGNSTAVATKTRARMPSLTAAVGGKSVSVGNNIEAPEKATISMDELGLATAAEKNRKGYLSTYLEGQTPINKISSFLGGKKL
jgi:hypothetical protein